MRGSLLPTPHRHKHTDTHTCTLTCAQVCTRERAPSMYTCTRKPKASTCVHRTRTSTAHTNTRLCRWVHTYLHAHEGPHTRVRRYAGEPTPSMLTCTHTQAQAGPHTRVFVQTHVSTCSEQIRTDTRERTPSRRGPHVRARTRPHTHTGRSAQEGISCPLHPDDRLPLAP